MEKHYRFNIIYILISIFFFYLSGINNKPANSNPIPTGIPYITMITEDMDIYIDNSMNAKMHGIYTFYVGYYLNIDSIEFDPPPWDYTMYFPKPKDAYDISVIVNNINLDYTIVDSLYLTTADSFFVQKDIPEGLDSLDMIMWSFVIDSASLIKVEVIYSHPLVETGEMNVFLYTLGTGRYINDWKPPYIGGNISGKPFVDVSITTRLPADYTIVDYFPKSFPFSNIQINQYESNDTLIFDWEVQEIECTKDFFLGIKQKIHSNINDIKTSLQQLWMDVYRNEITCYIPENGRVIIDILDINGRIVKSIINRNFNSGRHKILWDYSYMNINEGIYIIRLRTKNDRLSRRFVVINN